MTIQDVLSKIERFKPTQIGNETIIEWLSNVEWQIKRDIIDTHQGKDAVTFNGYSADTPYNQELIAPAPYDNLYLKYVEAQIDMTNNELSKYNNSATAFNVSLDAFSKWYNSTHMPLQNTHIKYF